METSVQAEGRVLTDSDGQPYFEGKIKNDKKAEFDVPENDHDSKNFIDQLVKSANFSNLFDKIMGTEKVKEN